MSTRLKIVYISDLSIQCMSKCISIVGLDAGTVVISEAAVDGILRSYMEIVSIS